MNYKITKEETLRLHRELWNWLADHPEEEKEDWPGWKKWILMTNYCFLCNYESVRDSLTGKRRGCCLLDWETTTTCYNPNSIYILYGHTRDLKLRAKIARQIANLKESSK